MNISIKQYATILDKALASASGDNEKEKVIKDFANLIVSDGRSSKLSEIMNLWQKLYNKRHGIIDVTIESADKDTISFPHSFAGKKVAVSSIENKSLIGGSVIKIGDYTIDASIKRKLSTLR